MYVACCFTHCQWQREEVSSARSRRCRARAERVLAALAGWPLHCPTVLMLTSVLMLLLARPPSESPRASPASRSARACRAIERTRRDRAVARGARCRRLHVAPRRAGSPLAVRRRCSSTTLRLPDCRCRRPPAAGPAASRGPRGQGPGVGRAVGASASARRSTPRRRSRTLRHTMMVMLDAR